ncbi:hypothetical protein [Moorena sp. SIO4G3]|nr:hypothetical protein [Moorena sp. SIO4G3]
MRIFFPYSRLDAKREWGKPPHERLHRYSLLPTPYFLFPLL